MHASSDIVPLDKRTPGIPSIEPLIFPDQDRLYTRRITRLRHLATEQGEESGAYFRFLADLVSAQQTVLQTTPLSQAEADTIRSHVHAGPDHLDTEEVLSTLPSWKNAFTSLTENLSHALAPDARASLHHLTHNPDTLSRQAAALLRGAYENADPGAAVIIWAALSVCQTQAVRQTPPPVATAESPTCPCCGAPPAGSLILGGDREGLRYLQCSLCETRWHRVRGICIGCGASGHLEHWSLDTHKAPVQAESCEDCMSYLKVFRLDYNPDLEAVADDTGSFLLDSSLQQHGFTRMGLNPFSFPA